MLQYNEIPHSFVDESGKTWVLEASKATKSYQVYQPGEDPRTSTKYTDATYHEAAAAYAAMKLPRASDWMANGIAAAAAAAAAATPVSKTLAKYEKRTGDDSPEITAAELLDRRVEAIPCLIGPIFQAVGLAAVVGSSDVGKSAFLRQMAFAVATGQSHFLAWPIHAKHHSVIYVSTEDDENATAFLLQSLNKTQQKLPADCTGLRFLFDTHDTLNELDSRLAHTPADLVIVDAFGDLYAGDANKTNQIRQFLHGYSQLAQKHGCLVLWLHHTGKRTDDDAPSKHHVIGGQGFEGKMRLLIELRRDHADAGKRHLCVVKGNYLPDDYKQDSYVLDFENFEFVASGQRVAFEQLAKPKETTDAGREKYDDIQRLRKLGHKGDVLANHAGMSKSYISKLEARYGPKEGVEAQVSSQFPVGNSR